MIYLVSAHKYPSFYSSKAELVDIVLDYDTTKCLFSLDGNGDVICHEIKTSSAVCDGLWMVKNIDNAIEKLNEHGVYPFKTKEDAKNFAKRHGLIGFRYLPVKRII
ncbi:hypothetical protein ACTFQF_00705 [Aliivibrio fischeri]|uniref:Uncharacterized protein n=1 Tax=Aliivibrio fischeri (strain MJ11) TaxID=388396 RepID=B5EWA4_ALIFM|nr:hypothetical protein [Aliivibrio fischeri]ACH64640.1 conserved hypothetical protein [Aliivibrio fischeri MJ11]MUK37574.1 hypothetical protein [Aliivibrio fischeri]